MSKIEDSDDSSWLMLLALHQIVQMLCAPALNDKDVATLICVLNIAFRQSLFPSIPLRPKHHFLLHYPYFIIQYGPLSRVWTLRFESKHRYFKRVVKSCSNFVNATRTLPHHHQMLLSHLLELDLFNGDVELMHCIPTEYSSEILACLNANNINVDRCCFKKM